MTPLNTKTIVTSLALCWVAMLGFSQKVMAAQNLEPKLKQFFSNISWEITSTEFDLCELYHINKQKIESHPHYFLYVFCTNELIHFDTIKRGQQLIL